MGINYIVCVGSCIIMLYYSQFFYIRDSPVSTEKLLFILMVTQILFRNHLFKKSKELFALKSVLVCFLLL